MENLRKMLLAMAQDVRAVIMKLAIRLVRMRTLDTQPEQERRRLAQETLDIFTPLANRLGMGRFKWELEDLALRHLEPSLISNWRALWMNGVPIGKTTS
ncbi:MAG: HD domain-containing protein [Candidatus Competibacteraceae bacterium]